MSKRFWKIKNQKSGTPEIMLYEQIGKDFWSDEGIAAKDFAGDLKALGDVANIDIRFNSPGGSVFEGLAMYNILKSHPAQKTGYVDGLAASIASVILMACDLIVMPENSLVMIHKASGITMGDSNDMRKMAEILDKTEESIIMAYQAKTGLAPEELMQMMAAETWMNGKDALDKGFCDECTQPMKMAAHFKPEDLKNFRNLPEDIKDLIKNHGLDREIINTDGHQPVTKEVAKMDKCTIHGCDLVNGRCLKCDADLTAKAMTDERTRVSDIKTIGNEYKGILKGADVLADAAIVNGSTIDQFRMEILNKLKDPSAITVTVENLEVKKPFRNLGEQLLCIRDAALMPGKTDKRLLELNNAALGSSEGVPSDGGFLVQPDFSLELLKRTNETGVLAPKCRRIQIGPNADGLRAPIVDEVSRATGSRWGGVQVYWAAEAAAFTKSKPKIGRLEIPLEKLIGLWYATDESLRDATALTSLMMQAMPEEFGFMIDDAIINGDGLGKPLGIFKSDSFVSAAKVTSQTATTVVAGNVMQIFAQQWIRGMKNAEWYINQEILPQLMQMYVGQIPLWIPGNNLANAPYGILMGRPVNAIEQAAALGTVGDITLMDLSQYALIEKDGLVADQSIHVQFVTDETAFKWVLRTNGQPIWRKALTPYKGSITVSPFVGVATRS